MTSSGSMPTSAATAVAARRLSPVSSTGRSPSRRSSPMAVALVGLTVSATASNPRTSPSADEHGCVALPLGAGLGLEQLAVGVHRPVGQDPLAPDDHGVALD